MKGAAPKRLLLEIFGARVERRRQRLERLAPKMRNHPPTAEPQRALAVSRLHHERLLDPGTVAGRDVEERTELAKQLELLDLQLELDLAQLGLLGKAPAHGKA